MKGHKYIYSVLQLVVLVFSLVTDWYGILSCALTALLFISCIDKLGKGIVLRELIAFHGSLICLFMPYLGYAVYTKSTLARLWVRNMPIPQDVYFSFALPAMAIFVIALCWPLNNKVANDDSDFIQSRIEEAKKILNKKSSKGVYLLIIGLIMLSITDIVPASLRYITVLFYWSAFSGFLYIYFSPSFSLRVPVLLLFSAFILWDAIRGGMFTVVAYMGITILSFFFLKKRVRFWKKLAAFLLGAVLLIMIQSVKSTYRKLTWRGNFEGNKVALFSNLISDKLGTTPFFSSEGFFPIYYRANQGFNIGLVMRRIPKLQPYDNGSTLGLSLASSIVPRAFWPDKPEAGGKFNMKYYAGMTLRGWSTNIGPLGEAYGGFGVAGGIIFMFVLGAFIRFFYIRIFKISRKIPLLLFWLPVLFYQVTYSMETDTMQILNSLFKASFFIWILYKFSPSIFGVEKEGRRVKEKVLSIPNLAN